MDHTMGLKSNIFFFSRLVLYFCLSHVPRSTFFSSPPTPTFFPLLFLFLLLMCMMAMVSCWKSRKEGGGWGWWVGGGDATNKSWVRFNTCGGGRGNLKPIITRETRPYKLAPFSSRLHSQFSSVQGGISAFGKAHTSSTQSLRHID